MKKFFSRRRIAALGIIIAAALIGLGAFLGYLYAYSGVGAADAATNTYEMDADYSLEITPFYSEGAIRVVQNVQFTNGADELDRLVFCLPQNAYRRSATAPMDSDKFAKAFTDNYTPGGISFTDIYVDGAKVEWGVSGGSEAILTVLYDIAPEQSVDVRMEYYALIPEFYGAGGFDANEWRLSGFYPYLAYLDEGEWTAYAPTYIGQYSYAQTGDYEITLHASKEYDVIASGSVEIIESADGWNTWRITAPDVREFSLVMRKGGCVYERDVRGVKVRVYGRDRLTARRAVDTAATAIEYMDGIYEYPYTTLNILTADYTGRDQSLSGMIIIDSGAADFEAQLVYLIARQWWGGLVSSDPVGEAWLSEALAQYSALTCAQDTGLKCAEKIRGDVDAALNITLPGGLTVESNGSAFSAQTDYDSVLRMRGAAVMEMLNEVMEGRLNSALGEYARANAFGTSSRAKFVEALDNAGSGKWGDWLAETLQGIGQAG